MSAFKPTYAKSYVYIVFAIAIYLVFSLPIYYVESYLLHFLLSVLCLCLSSVYLFNKVLKFYLDEAKFGFILGLVLIQVIIGLIHYLLFINPDYFNNVDVVFKHIEYSGNITDMRYVADVWRANGLFSDLGSFMLNVHHPILLQYMGLQFYCAGPQVLGFCTFNVLHSLCSATLMTILADRLKLQRDIKKTVFLYVMLMPFLIQSSQEFRDIVGLFVVISSVYFIICSYDSVVMNTIMLPIAGFMASTMREAYFIPIVVIYAYNRIKNGDLNHKIFTLFVLGFLGVAVLSGGVITGKDINADLYYKGSMGNFILGPILAIVGFFPWTNAFDVYFWEYLPFDFAQIVLNVSLWSITIYKYFIIKVKSAKDKTLLITAISFFILAAFNNARHISYVTVATPFLLPYALDSENYQLKYSMGVIFLAVTFCFVVGSILYDSLGLAGSGLLKGLT